MWNIPASSAASEIIHVDVWSDVKYHLDFTFHVECVLVLQAPLTDDPSKSSGTWKDVPQAE